MVSGSEAGEEGSDRDLSNHVDDVIVGVLKIKVLSWNATDAGYIRERGLQGKV